MRLLVLSSGWDVHRKSMAKDLGAWRICRHTQYCVDVCTAGSASVKFPTRRPNDWSLASIACLNRLHNDAPQWAEYAWPPHYERLNVVIKNCNIYPHRNRRFLTVRPLLSAITGLSCNLTLEAGVLTSSRRDRRDQIIQTKSSRPNKISL